MRNDKNELRSYLLNNKKALKKQAPFFFKKKSHLCEFAKKQTKPEYNRGYLFEQFIVSLFTPEYFTLLEWRSDKFINGIYPLTCKFPDLEYYFESQSESLHIAVECKWRRYFVRETFDWAKTDQLENYQQFEKISAIPVFMILGVGGEEGNPSEVYIIPLKDIDNIPLHSISLKPYQRRSPSERLFLNCSKLILT